MSIYCLKEEDDYKSKNYSLFTEWEAALLIGEPLWAAHAKPYTLKLKEIC